MSLDTYDEHSSRNPKNEKEIEVEEETVIDWEELYRTEKQRLLYKTRQLEKLASFHQIESWGMSLNYDQLKEKQEIINQYLP